MTLTQMIYFEKIAEIGNMGKAAELLHISQPSLSISIANLEKELNVTLFNRVGHKLLLSSEGQQFLTHVKTILAAVHDTQLHMQSLSADRNTHIRIGCISPVLYDYLPRMVREFLSLPGNEDIHVDFTTDNTSVLVPNLKNGYFDYCVCSETKDSDVIQTELIEEPYVLLCPPGADIPQTWQELLEKDLIGFHIRAATHDEIHNMLVRLGIQPTYLYRAPDEESIAALVSHGFGYGITPHIPAIDNYDLQVVSLPEPHEGMVRYIYLTQLVSRPPIGAAKRFLDFLNDQRKQNLKKK